ncbi:N-acetylmuramoyl-L-alanine amidase [Paenibacillus solisilvae]|uniref:N-acetylmuramoyl-L-alanine amidase n=1 Tax=Paenibacillus solisilvae TaxID=2486751 RepID=A0ABW0VV06_9BACL
MKTLISLTLIFCLLFSVSGFTSATADAEGPYTVKVASSTLNVRSEPSLKATIAGTLEHGAVVTVNDEENGWLNVSYNRSSGWIAGYYTKKVEGSGLVTADYRPYASSSGKSGGTTAKQGTVLADSLRVRSGAGSGYKVIGGLVQGEKVTIMNSRDGWMEIRTPDGMAGWVSSQYISKGTGTTTTPRSSAKGLNGKVIVIDPGHGGSDPGMIGVHSEALEKDLTLSTSFYIRDELRRRGATVILTRTKDDQKPSLAERVRISESAHADAFVSVHYNSSEKKTSGTLTFFYSDTKDKELAHAIENELGEGVGLPSNGISFGDFHVLRENDTVSALVELGFLSSAKDEDIVRTSGYQKKAAAAIAQGLADYFE